MYDRGILRGLFPAKNQEVVLTRMVHVPHTWILGIGVVVLVVRISENLMITYWAL